MTGELASEIATLRNRQPATGLVGPASARWRAAINQLLARGEFAAAAYGAHLLLDADRSSNGAQTVCRMLDVAPPTDDLMTTFVDDGTKELQIAPDSGSDSAVLVFSDVNNSIGMPFAFAHLWFGRLDATILYLRDFQKLCFIDGIRSLAPDWERTIRELRGILRGLGVRRLVCYGNSIGGFAAIQYAIALQAEAVISAAGPSDLSALRSAWGRRLQQASPVQNLRELLAAADAPPEVLVVCGEDNWDDRLQAENIGDLSAVTVRLVERFDGHTVANELICRQQFDRMLQWLLPAEQGARRTMEPFRFEPWRELYAQPQANAPGQPDRGG
jgi:pimeloyl-ACP methyl ester carboxylesterase